MIKRHLTPSGHRVLVKLKHVETKTAGGIIIETEQSRAGKQAGVQEAYVMDIAPDAWPNASKPWCKIGDLVLIVKYSGVNNNSIEDNEIYQVINDEDVLGVFEGEGL